MVMYCMLLAHSPTLHQKHTKQTENMIDPGTKHGVVQKTDGHSKILKHNKHTQKANTLHHIPTIQVYYTMYNIITEGWMEN